MALSLSRRTYYRILEKHHIKKWIAKKRPYLTEAHAQARLSWCQIRKDWTTEEWKSIIFSDECSVERGAGAQRVWVWRTPSQKWDKDMIQPVKTGKDISIMIWGAIWLGNRSDLVIMKRDDDAPNQGYSARSYITVLEEQMPRIYQPSIVFIQDGARIHSAKKVKEWLAENGIETLPWPAYSPDLNPIENLWSIMKQLLNKNYPDLLNAGASQVDIDTFARAINDTWHNIPQDVIDSLIQSMDSRVNHCLDAEGWQTRY
jgi:hypothetical protein